MSTAELTAPPEVKMQPVNLSFYHGLGDISNFARLIPVYKKYGIDIGVKCTKDKEIIIQAAGGRILADHDRIDDIHRWFIQNGRMDQTYGNNRGWEENKTGCNMRHYGLEHKANMEQLWKDLKEVDVQLKPFISQQDWDTVYAVTEDWPRPIVLWHSIGNTNQQLKSFNREQEKQFAYELLDRFEGTLLILDWDSRATWTQHNRLKHMQPEFGSIDISRLAALMYKSQLMIGIDSGPFYLSALTDIPSVGCFFEYMHPAKYMIPLNRSLTITKGAGNATINRSKRFEWQTVTSNESIGDYAEWSSRMLKPRRYLPKTCNIASDVHLQSIVQRFCRGVGSRGNLSDIMDRNHSFDILFQECGKRNAKHFVETGCIRSDEDWGGAGFSTVLFARYAQLVGGSLTSFDLSPANCNYARNWCRQFPSTSICESRGEDGLKLYNQQIDVLYLDSLDSEHSQHQEENLKEFKAAEIKLHQNSIVCIDDTPGPGQGKGGATVKYMLANGWKFLYRGYQVVLARN